MVSEEQYSIWITIKHSYSANEINVTSRLHYVHHVLRRYFDNFGNKFLVVIKLCMPMTLEIV